MVPRERLTFILRTDVGNGTDVEPLELWWHWHVGGETACKPTASKIGGGDDLARDVTDPTRPFSSLAIESSVR